jgi:hypothetical protein
MVIYIYMYTLNIDSLKLLYFAHFHSRVNYGIIFWGAYANLHKLFLIAEKIIGIMLGLCYRYSCRIWFKELDILTIPCLYTLCLMNFVVSNCDKFTTNLSVRSLNTRQKNHLHRSTVCFFSIQNGVTYSVIKVCNSLPPHIVKLLNNEQHFKHALKEYLIMHAFILWKNSFESHKIYK